jgi:cob(I)alamin adenosyltransferase
MAYLHIYTGNAKGKTTCAMGLAIRALGAGIAVTIIQFDKGYDGENEHYNERKILRSLAGVTLLPYGLERMMPDGKFRFQNTPGDLTAAAEGLEKALEVIAAAPSEKAEAGVPTQLIILDEVVTSVGTGLLAKEAVMDLVSAYKAHPAAELVLTGRGAWPELIAEADLVTEMTLVKHYFYEHKAPARPGIDY